MKMRVNEKEEHVMKEMREGLNVVSVDEAT